ncbi:MAG: acetylxylan esterase [Clostridia bacterium]|nr:acetylxylan esterase [Clostridia bacterium]
MVSIAEDKNFELYGEYTPLMRYTPDMDFSEWQKAARAKLSELLGMDKYVKCDPLFNIEYKKDCDTYTEYRFTIQSEENYFLPVVMRVPHGCEVGKHPVILCLQGHSTGFHISLGVPVYDGDVQTIKGGDRDFCVRAVKEGYIAVAIEQRGFGECKGDEDYPRGCHLTSMVAMLTGRSTLGERAWDVMRVIDVLLDEFDFIDEEKICLMGNSGGGTATYYTCCLDERIALCMPSSAVCSWDMSVSVKRHCTCNYVANMAKYFDMGDMGGMIAPRKLIIVHGVTDVGFYKPGVDKSYAITEKLYDIAGVPHHCDLVTGPFGHRFYADLSWPVVHKMMGTTSKMEESK